MARLQNVSRRRCVLISLLLLGSAGARAARAQIADRLVGAEPAPQPQPAYPQMVARQAARAHAQTVRLLFVGDSTTANWMRGGDVVWQNHRVVWDRWYGDRQAFDMGVNGDQTQNVLWRLAQGEADGLAPQLIVLLIGTNNVAHGQSPEQTATGVAAVVEDLHRRMPRAHILLLGILPHTPAVRNQATAAVNARLAQRAPGWPFVTYRDVGGVLLAGGAPDPRLYMEGMQPNYRRLLHPNAYGAERIARAIEPEVSRWLGDRNKLAAP